MMTRTVLHIDSSARRADSTTRSLSDQIVKRLNPDRIVRRDLSTALPHVTEDWVRANFTPADQRSDDQKETLMLSDQLVSEVADADVLVIGLPVYNFGVPASLKTWIDLICRAGLSFQYGAEGPVGLMTGKRAIVALASGGTEMGSDMDFASGYLRHVLGFIGITDIEFVAADRMAVDPDAALKAAHSAVERLAA